MTCFWTSVINKAAISQTIEILEILWRTALMSGVGWHATESLNTYNVDFAFPAEKTLWFHSNQTTPFIRHPLDWASSAARTAQHHGQAAEECERVTLKPIQSSLCAATNTIERTTVGDEFSSSHQEAQSCLAWRFLLCWHWTMGCL